MFEPQETGVNTHPSFQLEQLTTYHWNQVSRIYQLGIDTGIATFEHTVPAEEKFFTDKIQNLGYVAVTEDQRVLGWIAATPVSTRQAYRGVIEHSVYVDPRFSGQGVANFLLQKLIEQATLQGYWMIQCSVFSVNHPSLSLHQKLGFREVGYRERIAQAATGPFAGHWMNTTLCELRLDHRPLTSIAATQAMRIPTTDWTEPTSVNSRSHPAHLPNA